MISSDDLIDHSATLYAPSCYGSLMLQGPSGGYLLHLAWPGTPAPPEGWPVVYLLDGETFPVIRELLRYQAGASPSDSRALPVIAALAHDGPSRRAFDYTPSGSAGGAPRFGGAEAFRPFLLGAVRDAVGERLPIDPDREMLAGHSLGGLFVLDTLFGGERSFAQLIVSSPSVWWDERALMSRVEQYAQHKTPGSTSPRSRLILSAAEYDQALSPAEVELPDSEKEALRRTRESRRMVDDIQAMAATLRASSELDVHVNILDGETHRSAWPRAVAQALRWHPAC